MYMLKVGILFFSNIIDGHFTVH